MGGCSPLVRLVLLASFRAWRAHMQRYNVAKSIPGTIALLFVSVSSSASGASLRCPVDKNCARRILPMPTEHWGLEMESGSIRSRPKKRGQSYAMTYCCGILVRDGLVMI